MLYATLIGGEGGTRWIPVMVRFAKVGRRKGIEVGKGDGSKPIVKGFAKYAADQMFHGILNDDI